MKTITFDDTVWKLVPVEVDPDMVGAFVDASAIEGPCWAEATDGEKQEVVRLWAPCWAALLAATPAPAPAVPPHVAVVCKRNGEVWVHALASKLDPLPDGTKLYATQDHAPTQEPLTETYIQTVPDKCDRIVWRGAYHHLPIEKPAQEVGLTECLKDVVSHHGSFSTALTIARDMARREGNHDDASYWDHELNVVSRMQGQAIAALRAKVVA